MTEKKRPPVRINLGNKQIGQMLKELKGLGWVPSALALSLKADDPMYLDVSRATYSGDFTSGKFFHFIGEETYASHADILKFRGKKLVRSCPVNKLTMVVASIK